jgi:hypothetical protein
LLHMAGVWMTPEYDVGGYACRQHHGSGLAMFCSSAAACLLAAAALQQCFSCCWQAASASAAVCDCCSACVALLQCYKAVPLLMEKQLRRSASGQQRANVMYAVSKLLRESKRELKARSKYGEWDVASTAAARPQQQQCEPSSRAVYWRFLVQGPLATECSTSSVGRNRSSCR